MQLVILDQHSKDYDYGDVISFECDGLGAVLVKRVVACPGDTVVIDDGTLYVNGKIREVFTAKGQFEYTGEADTMIQLEEGQYFIIGDNVAESKDSRYAEVGCVNEMDILGKVVD
jgi:signal peptidase I